VVIFRSQERSASKRVRAKLC